MRSEGQQGKMASEGDGGRPGGACGFLGPELRTGSQADVAPGSVTADTIIQQQAAAGTDQLRVFDGDEYKCMFVGGVIWWPGMPVNADCPRSRAIQNEFNKEWLGRRRMTLKADAASRQRWEALWSAQEAQEKAASARKRAARDQGNKTGPIRAGPCVACARQGGVCGFCKKRQRLAC